jgi:hypothetical protein
MNLQALILVANGLISTTYGYGEKMCGPPDHPRACSKGAITSTGEAFDPDLPTVAIAAPETAYFKAQVIGLKIKNGTCQPIRINDKMASRFFGERGFDITPAALKLLTGKDADSKWSGRLYICNLKQGKKR